MKPPIIPSKAHPIKAVHFTKLKESISFDLTQDNTQPTLEEDDDDVDPFLSFNSGKTYCVRCIDVMILIIILFSYHTQINRDDVTNNSADLKLNKK
jgi:hypothetical protein